MTILNRELNDRLSNLEACAENAPEGTYVFVKTFVDTLHTQSTDILNSLRAIGLTPKNDDRLRNLEVELFRFALLAAEDYSTELLPGEGFGKQINEGNTSIIGQAAIAREALNAIRRNTDFDEDIAAIGEMSDADFKNALAEL